MAVEDPKNVEEDVPVEAEGDVEDVEDVDGVKKDPADPSSSEGDDDIMKKKENLEDEQEEEEDELPGFLKFRGKILTVLKYAFYLLVVVYLLASFIIDFERAKALFVITVLVVVYAIWEFWATNNEDAVLAAEDKVLNFLDKCDTDLVYAGGLTAFVLIIMAIVMAVAVRDGRNMVSLFGLICYLGLTWIFSWNPTKVQLRPVLGGIFIQFLFGW